MNGAVCEDAKFVNVSNDLAAMSVPFAKYSWQSAGISPWYLKPACPMKCSVILDAAVGANNEPTLIAI